MENRVEAAAVAATVATAEPRIEIVAERRRMHDAEFRARMVAEALVPGASVREGGGVGAVVPGFLELNVKAGTKLAPRAGGALAVFVVLYFWSPAHWTPPSPGPVVQRTGGTGSPAQNGTGNSVVINGIPTR